MKLSVIIPAYNREHLIGETLRSLLNQTLPADEIIVVDDGSTDETSKAAQAAFEEWEGSKVKGKKFTNFRIIRQENRGPAAARNTGFAVCKGEFIHFFDSDDLAAPNKQEVQLHALVNSGADIAYGPWLKGRMINGTFLPSNHVLQQHGLPRDKDLIKSLLTYWSIVPHAAMFCRAIVEKVDGFSENLFGSEDQDMFLSSLLMGAKVVHTPDTIEFYREGDPGKITESQEGRLRNVQHWAKFLLVARENCLKQGIDPVKWFGFRRRAWETHEDLNFLGNTDEILSGQLRLLYDTSTPVGCYRSHRQWERWRGGIQLRLTGARALPCFRVGQMTPLQEEQLQLLGFRLG